MIARGEIYWATLAEPLGRRPVCILTRDRAIPHRRRVTCAPITTIVRGIASEVGVGEAEGLAHPSVVNCDNILTTSRAVLDPAPVGRLSFEKRVELDAALRYALGIRY